MKLTSLLFAAVAGCMLLPAAHAQSCRTIYYSPGNVNNYCGGVLGYFGPSTDTCQCADTYNVLRCIHAYIYGSTAQRACFASAGNQYNFCEDNQIPYYDTFYTCSYSTNGYPEAYPVTNPTPTPPVYNPEITYPQYTGKLAPPQFDPGQSLARAETLNLRLGLR